MHVSNTSILQCNMRFENHCLYRRTWNLFSVPSGRSHYPSPSLVLNHIGFGNCLTTFSSIAVIRTLRAMVQIYARSASHKLRQQEWKRTQRAGNAVSVNQAYVTQMIEHAVKITSLDKSCSYPHRHVHIKLIIN